MDLWTIIAAICFLIALFAVGWMLEYRQRVKNMLYWCSVQATRITDLEQEAHSIADIATEIARLRQSIEQTKPKPRTRKRDELDKAAGAYQA